MTTIEFDALKQYRSNDERDAVIGAMLLSVLQWIEPTGFGANKDMLFTNSQYRLMGKIIREAATGTNLYLADRIKPLYDLLLYYTENDINTFAKTLYLLHKKVYFWNLVYEAALVAGANKSLVNVIDSVINANNIAQEYYWIKDLVAEIERSMDRGIIFTDIITNFISQIPQNYNLNYQNYFNNIVVESNISTLYLGSDSIWRIKDSFISLDTSNIDAFGQYNNSRPFVGTVVGSNGNGTWDARYFPLFVKSKSTIKNDFPLFYFDNKNFNLLANVSEKSTPVSNKVDIENLDVTLNGLMPNTNDQRRIVSNIVGLVYPDFEAQANPPQRFYFHCKNYNELTSEYFDDIVEFDSHGFTYDTNPTELPAINHLMDSCTLTGTIFSIDPIKLGAGGGDVAVDFLLITGNFTLTETSTSNVYTNVAVWDARNNAFMELDLSESINNFVDNAANYFAKDDLIYKTDSYTDVYYNTQDVICSNVIFGFGTKLDNFNMPVTNGMFSMPGPFFVINAKKELFSNIVKLNFILASDFKELKEAKNEYQYWLTDLTSYSVQKIGTNDLSLVSEGDRDYTSVVMLYTGKGIFYLDLVEKRIFDKNQIIDQNVEIKLGNVIPIETLSGEANNFYKWLHPTTDQEYFNSAFNYNPALFNETFVKYKCLDDRLFDLLSYQLNISFNNSVINQTNNEQVRINSPIKLLVVSGWSKMGNLANTPAEYNNICSQYETFPKPVKMNETVSGSLIEISEDNEDRISFAEQTKVILAKLENQIEAYDSYGEGWESNNNSAFYSFQEIELPMGYGEYVYVAYVGIYQSPPPLV